MVFDQYVTDLIKETKPVNKIIGLRYFNVYGFGEAHKAHMTSVVYKFYHSYLANKAIQLFEGSEKINRDFIHIDDIVKVNLFCLESNLPNDIYNAGTGKASSFFALAQLFQQSFPDAKLITIPFPEILKNKYQYFTEAKMDKLIQAGYKEKFQPITEGVPIYLNKLINNG